MAKTKTIHASIKMTPKIRDMYCSFEYMEEQEVQDGDNIEEVRSKLWDTCYNEVANQINMSQQSM